MGILERLRADGLKLALDGSSIKCGPKHLLTDEHRALIRQHKTSIMQQLECSGCEYHRPPLCVAVDSSIKPAKEVYRDECWLFLESKTVH
jgi:hypothetical protein